MGRPPHSPEQKKAVMQSLITGAQEIVLSDGIDKFTIRGVAKKVGVNSAVLYRFFKDRNELLVFASLDYFKSYCIELSKKISESDVSETEMYYLTWNLFCEYGFKEPEMTELLFFSSYSEDIKNIIKVYMDLFPETLYGLDGEVRDMLMAGTFKERNNRVLKPLLTGKTSPEMISNINDLTISYFYYLMKNSNVDEGIEILKERMLYMAHCLIDPLV